MDIVVDPAAEDQEPVIRRLLELNAHDFSEIDGRDLGPHGEYGFRYLDHHWLPEDRRRTRRPEVVDQALPRAATRVNRTIGSLSVTCK